MKNAAEINKNITNDDVRSILRVLSEYKEGKFIYPGYLAKDLGMDIYRVYEVLDSIRNAGYLEMIYEIKGKVSKKYSHLSTIPDGKITEAYVIYKLKTRMNFGKELDNDKSIPLNGKRFYYDPEKTELTEDLLKELSSFKGKEDSYFVYYDKSQGLVIY